MDKCLDKTKVLTIADAANLIEAILTCVSAETLQRLENDYPGISGYFKDST